MEKVPGFKPDTWRVALSVRVLAVATTRIEGTWCAYVDAVPGKDHLTEQDSVLRRGEKLPEGVARAIFRWLDHIPYG